MNPDCSSLSALALLPPPPFSLHAEGILDFVLRFHRRGIVRERASCIVSCWATVVSCAMNFEASGLLGIEAICDPDRADVELRKIVGVRREARHVVGVIVREYDEREVIARLFHHVLHAFVDAADVGRMHAAIDQDMRGAVLSGTVNRKKSPNPTRYIRTRMLAGPRRSSALRWPLALAFAAGVAFRVDFRARAALLTSFCGELSWCSFAAAFAAVFRGTFSGGSCV